MRISRVLWIGAVAPLLVAGSSLVGQAEVPAASHAEVDALTRPRYDLKLGFAVAGKVLKVYVHDGDTVTANDPLIELDDKEGATLLDLYTLQANSELEVQAKVAQAELAELKSQKLKTLEQQHSATHFEVEEAAAEAKIAKLEADLAREKRKETEYQLTYAQVKHSRFMLKTPELPDLPTPKLVAKVETVLVHDGETVEAEKPVLRLVVTNPLWVDAAVPFEQTLKLRPGGSAWVRSKVPGRDKLLKGEIKYVAEVADPGSDTRIVRIEIKNDDAMPAGEHVGVSFTEPAPLAEASPKGDR